MITMVKTDKYADCLSCGCRTPDLLKTFEIGRRTQIKFSITLCNKCVDKLINIKKGENNEVE